MTTPEILKELRNLGSPSTKAMLMRNHGVQEPCFGVKIGDLKKIVKRVGCDYKLALELYDTGNYDAMYLAGLIADDASMTRRDLQRWAEGAYGGALPGYTVAWVAAQSRHGWEMGLKWIDSPKPHVASAGWSTLACVVALRPDAELDLVKLKRLLARVGTSMSKAPDWVRSAMNGFLISVGCYVTPLTDEALKVGEKLGPVKADLGPNQCRIPFAPDYIRKVEQRGLLGRKRRTVKC